MVKVIRAGETGRQRFMVLKSNRGRGGALWLFAA